MESLRIRHQERGYRVLRVVETRGFMAFYGRDVRYHNFNPRAQMRDLNAHQVTPIR